MKLIGSMTQIVPVNILVVGDLMLDSYTLGKVSRISPEAPVPVVRVTHERSLPGGAGNVALNLVSLGMKVAVLGRYGSDSAGKTLRQELKDENISIDGLFEDSTFRTPIKNRVIVDNHQMIRIDHEEITPLSEDLETIILNQLPLLLKDIKVIAISDYGKGFLTRRLLQGLIQKARELNIPVIADPKGADFTKYKGATLLKPNLKEATAAANLSSAASLDEIAKEILFTADVDYLMITRSEQGISLFNKESFLVLRQDFPVKVKEVVDVTGAGDTVLAVMSAAMGSGLSFASAAELSNVAASLAIEHVGCARITFEEMASRLLEEQGRHKLIDVSHAPALYYALRDKPHTIIELSDESTLDPELFEKIQALKATSSNTLLMSVPVEPKSPYLIPMLESLREVDFVLLR